jgi:LmbE family N-acetylglucosaminyl deacetylase|tara:strand:+ start:51 stop:698 length:648 start_codon:yes stop_codon:yes gene_type:complete
MVKEKVLVLCAHNDDQIIGAGGTMARYIEEGKKVKTYVFFVGENSHPHLKRGVIRKERIREAIKSDKILGGGGVEFLDLHEGNLLDVKEQLKAREMLKKIFSKEKPDKIFTHNMDDPHPDHRAVLKVVMDVVKLVKFKGDVYSFNVWNPLNVRRRNEPKLIVNISKTFGKKIKSFLVHKSQMGSIISLLWSVYFQAIVNGRKKNCRYAEVFFKIQ